jgi:hypothetical protein
MRAMIILLLLISVAITAGAQQPDSGERLRELERKLDEATRQIEQLGGVIQSLSAEISAIRGAKNEDRIRAASRAEAPPQTAAPAQASREAINADFVERIIDPKLGRDERDSELKAKPEVFIQARSSALPIRGGEATFKPNFSLTRIESLWAGKVTDRVGAGLELQFHPALEGSPEEIVNDAFVEYYLSGHATVRVGQFIKPFGFQIQQSSAVRESPERGIFAGYFFPGQRDRGIMIFGDLDSLNQPALKNVYYYFGAFNGNRFFADNNRQLNNILRVRKVLDRPKLAIGVSLQRGKQLLPEGVSGNNNEHIVGLDFQYALGRLGFRGEFVAGNTPSTLLGIKPEFAPAFRPGKHSEGGYFFTNYRLSGKDNVYARYEQFNGDPVTDKNIRAFNFGYFRKIGEFSRLSLDYTIKRRPSFNDDPINERLHLTWGIEF